MEQPMSHQIDSSTKQFGNNTITTTQQSFAVIDSTPECKEDLLIIVTELKAILQDSIKTLSPTGESIMTENSKHVLIASIAGCADPQRPYHPTSGNNCQNCTQHSEVTCHDFQKKQQP
jgi:hypothetical protein